MRSKTVEIIPSEELEKMKLKSLIGRRGIIVAEGRGSGLWVELEQPYQDEKEWFIPYKSLQLVHTNA